jgi:hypothetical protein
MSEAAAQTIRRAPRRPAGHRRSERVLAVVAAPERRGAGDGRGVGHRLCPLQPARQGFLTGKSTSAPPSTAATSGATIPRFAPEARSANQALLLCLVELRGFEPPTPCMPLLLGWFVPPRMTSCPLAITEMRRAAEGGVVWGREVGCGAVSGKSLARSCVVVSARGPTLVPAALDRQRLAPPAHSDSCASPERPLNAHERRPRT